MFLNVFNALLEQHGLNKRQFSIQSGIPYTTIDGFYKKGYENIRLGTLRKIATFFDVSLDFLVYGKEREITPAQQLAMMCAKLNDTGQAKAIEYIEDLTENEKYTTKQPTISDDITNELTQDALILSKQKQRL